MNLKNIGYLVLGVVFVSVLDAGGAIAYPIYDTTALAELSGTRSTSDNGLVIGGGSATAATISWDIAWQGSYYHYSYDFSYSYPARTANNQISHFILDLSDDCTANSGCAVLTNDDFIKEVEFGIFGSNGNPNFPGSITGVKFDITENISGNSFSLEFDSARVPVYGDFYSKGGNGDKNGFAIYNTGATDHLSENYLHFIARPDTVTSGGDVPVPEPASLILLGTGLGMIGLLARRRMK